MKPYEIITALIGVSMALSILYLIRRDHMQVRYSLWWFAVAAGVIVFGLFPGVVDMIGNAVGVAYPPTLLLVFALTALLLKILLGDIEVSRTYRKLLRLTQRMVILEQQVRKLSEKKPSKPGATEEKR